MTFELSLSVFVIITRVAHAHKAAAAASQIVAITQFVLKVLKLRELQRKQYFPTHTHTHHTLEYLLK